MAERSTLFPGQYLLSNYCIFMERFNPCLLQHLVLELNKKTSDEKILQPEGENGHFFFSNEDLYAFQSQQQSLNTLILTSILQEKQF